MIEFAFLGYFALFFAFRFFSLESGLVSVALLCIQKKHAEAEKRLNWTLTVPSLPWTINKRALALNLKAHLSYKGGRDDEAREICEQVLSEGRLSPAVRGLIHARLAELEQGAEARAHRSQAQEWWDAGKPEFERLKLWRSMAYFFFATGDRGRAAFCFDELIKKTPKQEYYRFRAICFMNPENLSKEFLPQIHAALDHETSPAMKTCLWATISAVHQLAAEYQEAWGASSKAMEFYPLGGTPKKEMIELYDSLLLMQIYQLRAIHRYEEAEQTRQEWLQREPKLASRVGLLHTEMALEDGLRLLEAEGTPELKDYHYAMGTVLVEMAEPLQAIEHLELQLAEEFQTMFIPSAATGLVNAYQQRLNDEKVEEWLQQVPDREYEWVQSMRLQRALFWEGDPEKAKPWLSDENPQPSYALYVGDFEKLREDTRLVINKAYLSAPKSVLEGKLSYYLGSAHHWADQHEQALDHYEKAATLLKNSPVDRVVSRIFALECRAFLGQDVREEFLAHKHVFESRYQDSTTFHLYLRSAEIGLHLATGDFDTIPSLVENYLEIEIRMMYRARRLQTRAMAHEALGKPAKALADYMEIVSSVPGSYLATWAQAEQAHHDT